MEDFGKSIEDEYKDKLDKLYQDFLTEKKEIEGNIFIPNTLIIEFFKLLHDNKPILVSPNCIETTKKINDLVRYVFENGIAGGVCGLKVGQTIFNAHIKEYDYHTQFGFTYAGGGVLDHEYQHTGEGIPGTDFKLTQDFAVDYQLVDEKGRLIGAPQHDVVPAGVEIDAKDYYSLKTMQDALKNNVDGKLGHYGDSLIIHILTTDEYYVTKNIANAPVFKVLTKIESSNKQVKLSIDSNGILTVRYW